MMIPTFTWNSSNLFAKYLIHLGCQKADGYNNFIYTYDYENRMTEVKWNGQTLQENFYDCCGKRIKMKNYNENGELTYTIIYIYIGWNTIYEKTIYPDLTETETKYIYGVSGHIAKITDTGTVETTTFYHTDHLGSVRQKTDSDGQALWVSIAIYKPFGGIYSGGPSDDSETHLYTGKTYDYGTGLYYYGARFYDPKVGRFVTADPVKGGIGNPQSLNLYVYVLNNPLRFVDPAGMQIKKEITKEPPPPSDTDAEETTLNGDGNDEGDGDDEGYTSTVGNITVTYIPSTGQTIITVTNPDGSTESVTLEPGESLEDAIEALSLNDQEKENLGIAMENVIDQLGEAVENGELTMEEILGNIAAIFIFLIAALLMGATLPVWAAAILLGAGFFAGFYLIKGGPGSGGSIFGSGKGPPG